MWFVMVTVSKLCGILWTIWCLGICIGTYVFVWIPLWAVRLVFGLLVFLILLHFVVVLETVRLSNVIPDAATAREEHRGAHSQWEAF